MREEGQALIVAPTSLSYGSGQFLWFGAASISIDS